MSVKIHTEYRTMGEARTPGFYNKLVYDKPQSSGEVLIGPYQSRPLARIAAAELEQRMK